MEYYGIIPKRKLWVKLAVIIFGIYTIYRTIVNGNLFYLPFGFIMILATFSNKKHVISEKGINILYTACGMEFHNMWTWKDISIIYIDSKKSNPNVELHIGKDLVFRKFIFSADDVPKILDMLSKMNPKISVKEMNNKNK
ncbi:MAG: hypothetical protein SOY60_05755 [Fusobacterium gastrosuis]|uniref:hypothetical protein n=1 Tax=Fusobacterium gastrosuis TaxID=1755100 RepID=UPI002A8BD9C4|nr:hypothetical protein [Fusobacterium gastrosuis]